MKKQFYNNKNGGYLLIQVLVFGAMAVIIIGGLVSFAVGNAKLGRHIVSSEKAFQMAEAGLEYYRWHLAHAPTDYTDGTGGAGPYVKNFYDRNGVLQGTFTLTITAPPLGSTLITIQSVGVPIEDASASRTIVSKLAIPSFANFAAVTEAFNRFGSGTEVFGPIHSNEGIRFDGLAHNLVTSFISNFNDPDHSGNNELGVHTHVNLPPSSGINNTFRPLEAPPNPVQARPDVFLAGRSFPAPEVEFDDVTTDLEVMKTEAEDDGLYFNNSNDDGYRVVLKTNGNLDLYRVNSIQNSPSGCSTNSWTTGSTTFLGSYPFPANGLIFFNDNIWVQGIIDGARLTIVAARIPDDNASLRRSVTINNDVTYSNYDGTDTLALIGQKDVSVGLYSEDDLRIDAALVAQNGRVGRFNYNDNDCSPYHVRNTITSYGTIISSQRYGFAYVGGWGYTNRNLIYDSFLLYSPPPFFPQTEDFYEVISWKEIE